MDNVILGQFVFSKAGRDKTELFIVVGIEEAYVYLADGKRRRIERPKKKKNKHIQITNQIDLNLNKILSEQKRLTNQEIRKSIAAYHNSHNVESD